VLATVKRPPQRDLDPDAAEALREVEGAYDITDDDIDAVAAGHESEIAKITAALERMRLDPKTRLVLNNQRIVGEILRQYFQEVPDPGQRRPKAAAEAVAGKAREAVAKLDQAIERRSHPEQPFGAAPRRAYQHGTDCPEPTLICDPTPCALSGDDLEVLSVDTGLEFVVDKEAVHAAKHLAHIVAVGEQLGVLPAFDALVTHWDEGEYRFENPDLNDALYCTLRRQSRMSPQDRGRLVAAVLGVRGEGLAPGAKVNAGFAPALRHLVQEILRVLDDECVCERRRNVVSRATVELAADHLRHNIDGHVTGSALMRIRELRRDLIDAQAILGHEEVIEQVACGHRDGALAVVNILKGRNPTVTPNAVAISRADEARTQLLDWLATHPDIQDEDDDAFRQVAEAAVTLDAAEAWLAGKPRWNRYELRRTGDGRGELVPAVTGPGIVGRDA
jgi:hypothetical protein